MASSRPWTRSRRTQREELRRLVTEGSMEIRSEKGSPWIQSHLLQGLEGSADATVGWLGRRSRAAPRSDGQVAVDGNALVAKGATLADCCVKCGRRDDLKSRHSKFHWYPPVGLCLSPLQHHHPGHRHAEREEARARATRQLQQVLWRSTAAPQHRSTAAPQHPCDMTGAGVRHDMSGID